jgi:DNA repair photolyase
MTDPYMPLEKEIQYTRKALEIIDKYIITKSNLILRDLDLLTSKKSKMRCTNYVHDP